MPTPVSTGRTWHFGLYDVDASRVELRRNGSPIKLREQSFLVLIQLLERAGEIVTREELRQALWPSDTFVDFDHSLSTAVMKLREALGDFTGTPVYIETVPKHGYRFIAKVTAAEQNPALALVSAPVPSPVAAKGRGSERMWQLVAGLAAVLLVASTVWIAMHHHTDPAPPAMVRFQIPAPDKLNFTPWDLPAVSPDGQRIAFTAHSTLFVRSMNTATAIEIPTPGSLVNTPFWSPDGQQIAFSFWGNQGLLRVALSGGPPVTICSDCNAWLGGTWNRDGVILSATRTSLFRVSAAGGIAKLLPLAQGETAQCWPEFLPDGKHYLYLSVGKAPYQPGIYVASLDSNDRKFIVASDITPLSPVRSTAVHPRRYANGPAVRSSPSETVGRTAACRRSTLPGWHLRCLSERRHCVAPIPQFLPVSLAVVRSQRQETRRGRPGCRLLKSRTLSGRQQIGCLH